MENAHIPEEQLFAFALKELGQAETAQVAAHLDGCVACAKLVARVRLVRGLVRGDFAVEPPAAAIARAQAIFTQKRSATMTSLQPSRLPIALVSDHIAYEKLVAFARNELDPTDAPSVTEHISVCDACSKTVNEFKTIRSLRTDDSRKPPSATVARANANFTPKRPVSVPFWQRLGLAIPLPTARQFSMALMLVLFVLSNIILYTGLGRIVNEAQASIPGGSYYSAKLNLEDLQLATTWTTVGKLDKHLAYSGYRLDEAAALISIGRLSLVAETLSRFENEVNLVSSTFKTLAKEDFALAKSYAQKIDSTFSGYSAKLNDLRDAASEVIRPAFEVAVSTTQTIQASVNELVSQSSMSSSSSSVSSEPSPSSAAQPSQTPRPGSTGVPKPGATATKAASSSSVPAVIASPQPSYTSVLPPTATKIPPGQASKTPTSIPTKVPPGQASKTLTPVSPRQVTATPMPPTATPTLTPTRALPPGLERQTESAPTNNGNPLKGK